MPSSDRFSDRSHASARGGHGSVRFTFAARNILYPSKLAEIMTQATTTVHDQLGHLMSALEQGAARSNECESHQVSMHSRMTACGESVTVGASAHYTGLTKYELQAGIGKVASALIQEMYVTLTGEDPMELMRKRLSEAGVDADKIMEQLTGARHGHMPDQGTVPPYGHPAMAGNGLPYAPDDGQHHGTGQYL